MITSVTIEPNEESSSSRRWGLNYTVYQNGVYDQSSVLSGQPFKQLCKSFATIDEAKVAYPNAVVLDENTGVLPVYIPSTPPDWFDPMNAGEVWSEEDY